MGREMGEVFQLVKTVAGSDGGAAAITASAIVFVFWVYGKFVRMASRHDDIVSRCSELNGRASALEKDVGEIRGDMQYVKSTLNTLVNMVQNGGRVSMQSNSPLSLTDFGREMAAGMKADGILSRAFPAIRARIDADVPSKTPYDVQTYCLEKIPCFPEQYLDSASLDAVKSYAFANGRTLFECMKVIGLKARDEYFRSAGIPMPPSGSGHD